MSKPQKVFDKDLFFRALADRTRLRLLHLMGEDENPYRVKALPSAAYETQCVLTAHSLIVGTREVTQRC
jgi:hypothetical protein